MSKGSTNDTSTMRDVAASPAWVGEHGAAMLRDAADEIDALRAEVSSLRSLALATVSQRERLTRYRCAALSALAGQLAGSGDKPAVERCAEAAERYAHAMLAAEREPEAADRVGARQEPDEREGILRSWWSNRFGERVPWIADQWDRTNYLLHEHERLIDALADAKREALCNLLDRLGGDGATAAINRETPERVSDEIYAHVLREHAAPTPPSEEQIEAWIIDCDRLYREQRGDTRSAIGAVVRRVLMLAGVLRGAR